MKMRRARLLGVALLFLLMNLSAPIVRAAVTLYEPFDYDSTGTPSLTGKTDTYMSPSQTWTKSSANANDVKVLAGNLTYAGIPNLATTNNSSAQLNNAAAAAADRLGLLQNYSPPASGSTAVYYSFIMQVPSTSLVVGNAPGGAFFAGLNALPGTSTSGTQSSSAPVVLHQNGTNLYSLGTVYRDNGTRVFDDTKTFGAGETVFVVAKYIMNPGTNDDEADLWINPSSATFGQPNDPGSPNVQSINNTSVAGTADLPTTAAPLQSFMLRNNTSEPANIIVDEVRVGDTWKDVTSAVTVPVPEPTAFGILVFGATVAIRRRK